MSLRGSLNMSLNIPLKAEKRVVIVGAGFAGINVAKNLSGANIQVVLIDKHNHHTFQPLLYQVATSGLETSSIAYPIRRLFRKQADFHFRLAEAQKIDSVRNVLVTNIGEIHYDYLVLAPGSKTNFFGMEDVATNAMGLKSVAEAIDLRHLILESFEQALLSLDEERQGYLNFVLAGGGPTGVELAGALSEMKHRVLPKDYPEIDFTRMNIIMLDPGPRLLGGMSEESSRNALEYLKEFGVDVRLGEGVKAYDGKKITTSIGNIIPCNTMVWAAGVAGATIEGIDKELIVRGNRVKVDQFNRLEGSDNVFILGDLAYFPTEKYPNGLPGLAPVAIQQGRHCASNIKRMWQEEPPLAFRYFDKGSLATVGRARAVGDLPRRGHLRGAIAWLAWLVVHLYYLIGFRNRVTVLWDWTWSYFTYERRIRLIVRPFMRNQTKMPKYRTPMGQEMQSAEAARGAEAGKV